MALYKSDHHHQHTPVGNDKTCLFWLRGRTACFPKMTLLFLSGQLSINLRTRPIFMIHRPLFANVCLSTEWANLSTLHAINNRFTGIFMPSVLYVKNIHVRLCFENGLLGQRVTINQCVNCDKCFLFPFFCPVPSDLCQRGTLSQNLPW